MKCVYNSHANYVMLSSAFYVVDVKVVTNICDLSAIDWYELQVVDVVTMVTPVQVLEKSLAFKQ